MKDLTAEERREQSRIYKKAFEDRKAEERAKYSPEEIEAKKSKLFADAANTRESHARQYARQERGRFGLDKPSGEGNTLGGGLRATSFEGRNPTPHRDRGQNYSLNDGTAAGESGNRKQSSNRLYVPESAVIAGRTFNFSNNFALIGDGGPGQGTSRKGTYKEFDAIGDGQVGVIQRGNKHILVVGGNSGSGGDRSRAATYISADDAAYLKSKGALTAGRASHSPRASM